MIATIDDLKTHIGIAGTSEDTFLTTLAAGVNDAVTRYLGRRLAQTSYTEYYSGPNKPRLPLRQRPVSLTGLQVWLDSQGFWGQGPTAFAAPTLLTSGVDYALEIDQDAPQSGRGMLIRIGASGLQGMIGGIVYPSGLRQGTVSGWDYGSVWPMGQGNIKVTYTAGYSRTPAAVTLAACRLAALVRASRKTGHQLGSESYAGYSYSLMTAGKVPGLDEVRQMLGPFREIPI